MVQGRGLATEDGRVYRESTLAAELSVAQTLRTRAGGQPLIDHSPGESPAGDLTDEQWAAVRGAFAARISVLTGGPGVGKTVCTRAIVAEAEAAGAKIALWRSNRPRGAAT